MGYSLKKDAGDLAVRSAAYATLLSIFPTWVTAYNSMQIRQACKSIRIEENAAVSLMVSAPLIFGYFIAMLLYIESSTKKFGKEHAVPELNEWVGINKYVKSMYCRCTIVGCLAIFIIGLASGWYVAISIVLFILLMYISHLKVTFAIYNKFPAHNGQHTQPPNPNANLTSDNKREVKQTQEQWTPEEKPTEKRDSDTIN